ncbi:MAG: chemotaxis protein CheB [Bacteroidetes bacterium]|nr:chemotaxis protein CheB [Bacteroidota bacterium]
MVNVFSIAYSSGWAHRLNQLCAHRSDIQIVRTVYGNDSILNELAASGADIVAIEGGEDWERVKTVTRTIMEGYPLPVVILASEKECGDDLQSAGPLDAGALSLLRIPSYAGPSEEPVLAEQLVKSLRLMSEVKVVRRWDSARLESLSRVHQEVRAVGQVTKHLDIVVIGASAGGTKALQEVFSHLPAAFPLPILVVQHIAKGYLRGLAHWLDEQTELNVSIAENGQRLEGGTVYLAPDDAHLTVDRKHCILLADDEPVNGFKPSIARLFSSVHDTYGGHAVAILLSGMGNDGAQEMLHLNLAGAVTIAQDKDTSLIHGIPGEAIKLAAVSLILPIQEIGAALLSLTAKSTAEITKTEDSRLENGDVSEQE